MKLEFWLLDINPKKINGTIEIWLWGIDANGNRVLVVDENFIAYFYAIIKEGSDPSNVAKQIMISYSTSIVKAEVTDRKLFGKPVQAIKIYCKNADEPGKVAIEILTIKTVKDCLEDDIRAAMRYMIDNNIVPCSWHEVEAIEEKKTSEVRVDKIYRVKKPPKPLEIVRMPSLRLLGFSIVYYSKEGSPQPNRNPILIISTVTNNGEEKQFITNEDKNDKPIIENFIDYLIQFDPDIIVSYDANNQDWNFLKGRCHKHGLKLNFDRARIEPHTSVYGHISTTGIINLDLADFTDMFPKIKVRTLWNLAAHLGIIKDKQQIVDDVEFADYWDDKQKRETLKMFGLDSARKVQSTAILLLDFAVQLSSLTSLPLDHVMAAAVGFRVEWFLIKRVTKIGELIPKRLEQLYMPYTGGLVLKPQPGLHENIAVLDFKSMYPNIMLTYNLSPDTYISPNEPLPPSGVHEAPVVGHKFRKAPPGFYTEALTYLINIRKTICQKMKTLNPKTVEYHVLDARQKAVKILTNAAYGYVGWIGAKWYIKPVAEAASAWGRHIILTATKMAETDGIKVVYGDTDSLFIYYDEKRALKLQEKIKKELKLKVEVGQVYRRIFFTEAKKRYAGLKFDGSLDIVGLEVIRGDWAQVAKKVQKQILEIVLKEQSPKKAIDYVHNTITQLKQRKVLFRDLIIWKTLTKSPDKYAIKAPHVEAAKMLKEKGWRLTGGDKVGYVILMGKGRLFNRVKPYVFANYDEIDVDYYITNQVVPATARILGIFGVTEKELLKKEAKDKVTRNLMDFIGT